MHKHEQVNTIAKFVVAAVFAAAVYMADKLVGELVIRNEIEVQ